MTTEHRYAQYWYRLPTTVVVALSVLPVETVGRWILSATVGVGVRPTGAVVALTTVLLGPAAVPGAFLGTVLAGLVTSGSFVTMVNALGVGAGVLFGGHGTMKFGPDNARHGRAWMLRCGFVIVCAVCVTAAAIGLLSGVFGVAPFQLVIGQFLTTNLPLAVVVGPLAWYVARRAEVAGSDPESDSWTSSKSEVSEEFRSSKRRRAIVFAVASVGWVVAGYAAGFLFRATERVPADRIGDRLVPAAGRFLELVGPRGIVVQVLLGLVALSLLTVSVCWS